MIILDDSVILEGYKTGSMPGELSLRTKEYNLRNSCMHKKLLVLSNFAKQYCSCLGRWGRGGGTGHNTMHFMLPARLRLQKEHSKHSCLSFTLQA